LHDPHRGQVAFIALCEGRRSPHRIGGHEVKPSSEPLGNRWLNTLSSGQALRPLQLSRTEPPSQAQQLLLDPHQAARREGATIFSY